jgi:hypothetical protein
MKILAVCAVPAMLVASLFSNASDEQEKRPQLFPLTDGQLTITATPSFGGRLLFLGLKGHGNVLKVGDAVVTQPAPEVSPDSGNIGYLGHTVWVGPQSEWWVHQALNPKRKEERANWPPDPFLVLAESSMEESTGSRLVLKGAPSPVSGLQLRKTFELAAGENAMDFVVEAKNIRQENLAWDLWLNTRMDDSTYAYVPVSAIDNVRIENWESDTHGSLAYSFGDNIFSLDLVSPPVKTGRQGKAFIQPSEGWMAAFAGDQLLIVTFPLQPASEIHPEHGQVEIYSNYLPESTEEGLLEMEVHAPYRELAPGETMQASQRWHLFEYGGSPNRAAHVRFLKSKLRVIEQSSRVAPSALGVADAGSRARGVSIDAESHDENL